MAGFTDPYKPKPIDPTKKVDAAAPLMGGVQPVQPTQRKPLGKRGGNVYDNVAAGGHGVGKGTWGTAAVPGAAPDPGKGSDVPPSPGPEPPNPYGSESGNTYLEDRYLARLFGDDPAFNYAAKRGTEALGNRYSSAGAYNSGAARQGESDFLANLIAQSQGQLDALAAGATGARQNKLNSMFGQLAGLTGGMAGTGTAYDITSAGSNDALMNALIQLMGNKAGVDDKSRQGFLNNLFGGLSSIF